MRLPVVPIAVALVLLGAATALLMNLESGGARVLDAPQLSVLADVEGIETEVAIAPDGSRYAVIASGDLWLADVGAARRQRLTSTPDAESSPAWSPDGLTVTFTRGTDTIAIDPETRQETLYMPNAVDLAWSLEGGAVFVRDRALWVRPAGIVEAKRWIEADPDPRISVRSPRFSPTGDRVLYIKSLLGLRGEVWVGDISLEERVPLVADRASENPMSVEWIDNNRVVYLTDRAGGLAVWYIDLADNTMVPLTTPLMGRSLAPIGIDVDGERVVLPRHWIDADIFLSDGTVVAESPRLEFEPDWAATGDALAYTVENEGRLEIWTTSIDAINGSDATYLTEGHRPRFSPDGHQVVYTRTGLDGNADIWKIDVRTGIPLRLTDDPGVDETPDWSPDGRHIIFASEYGREAGLWIIPAAGGQRLRRADGGYAPRFSPDGDQIAFWRDGHLWVASADGSEMTPRIAAPEPSVAIWSGDSLAYAAGGRIEGERTLAEAPGYVWPVFDQSPNGTWAYSVVHIDRTELWNLQLSFVPQ